MHFLTTLIASALVVATAVQANIDSSSDHQQALSAIRRHHQRREAAPEPFDPVSPLVEQDLDIAPVEKRAKKCKNKNKAKHHHKNGKEQSKNKHHHKHNDSKQAQSKASTSNSGKIFGGKGSGLAGLKFASSCQPDANSHHPNGAQNFLNCGVDSNGWKPPNVKLSQLKMLSGDDAAKSSLFSPCKQYLWAFKQAEKNTGVPSTLLMAFAMQESTCNPKITGGNGEQGMMQITPDKCGGAPNGNCKDVSFNVNKGAQYFKSQLDSNNGNVLAAIGQYNGWQPGMTVSSATAAAKQGHCHAQNNLDYLYQMLNGWILGSTSDPYSMGRYQNLKNCN